MLDGIRTFATDEADATAIDYGPIAVSVSLHAVGAPTAMGTSPSTMFNTVSGALSTTAIG